MASNVILKKETLYNNKYKDLDAHMQGVQEWLEFYNTTRKKNKHYPRLG